MNCSRTFLTAALLGIFLTGCASNKKNNTISVSTVPANPVVQVIPEQGREPNPRVAMPTSEAEPIYRNPIIDEVERSPFIDENGDLNFPGKLLVIREPGRWNLDAAQRKNQYFIPRENLPPELVAPSKGYYDYVQEKKNGKTTATLDVSKVRVTGYTLQTERSDAAQTLAPGEALAFDPFLGWLAVPSERQVPSEQAASNPEPAHFEPAQPAASPDLSSLKATPVRASNAAPASIPALNGTSPINGTLPGSPTNGLTAQEIYRRNLQEKMSGGIKAEAPKAEGN